MGSTESRPRLRKVAPCNSLQEKGQNPKPQWTVPALPLTVEEPSGPRGQRRTTLPPLKQEITLSSLSEPCFAGTFPPKQSSNSSIIHSHPPRRPQALHPLALQIGRTSTANQIAMGRDRRDGDVHQYFTTGQTGTSRIIQGGFLDAQIALTQQTHQHRQTHLRQARGQRRHKVVYTVTGPNTEGSQRLKLVRRTTERDIFWDETTGKSLDPSDLLEPKSTPLFGEERKCNQPNMQPLCREDDTIKRDRARGLEDRQGERTVQKTGHRGPF